MMKWVRKPEKQQPSIIVNSGQVDIDKRGISAVELSGVGSFTNYIRVDISNQQSYPIG